MNFYTIQQKQFCKSKTFTEPQFFFLPKNSLISFLRLSVLINGKLSSRIYKQILALSTSFRIQFQKQRRFGCHTYVSIREVNTSLVKRFVQTLWLSLYSQYQVEGRVSLPVYRCGIRLSVHLKPLSGFFFKWAAMGIWAVETTKWAVVNLNWGS